MQGLGAPFDKYGAGEIEKAARRAEGSVRETLRALERQGAATARQVDQMLGNLPKIDWGAVQTLVDNLSKAQAAIEFDAFLETVFLWLDERVKANAGQGPRRLEPLAEAWEKIAEATRAAEIYNLDKRALILGIVEDLGAAAR